MMMMMMMMMMMSLHLWFVSGESDAGIGSGINTVIPLYGVGVGRSDHVVQLLLE